MYFTLMWINLAYLKNSCSHTAIKLYTNDSPVDVVEKNEPFK